jgi:hypothetical protein
LHSLLTEPSGAVGQRENGQIIAQIARAPKLKEEAASALPALEAALSGHATPQDILIVMAAKGPAYGLDFQDKSPEAWALMAAPYLALLTEFSADIIEAGFLAWDRGEVVTDAMARSFYPRPAQLYDGCVKAKVALASMRWRCKRAAEWGPPKPAEPIKRMTRAEMVAAGYMTEDGRVVGLGSGLKAMPAGSIKPHHGTPQQVAETLRRSTDAARSAGVPINRPAPPAVDLDDEVIV